MALSDQLSALAARAKAAEDRAAAAKQKAKTDLEQEAESAHQSAQDHADALRTTPPNGQAYAGTNAPAPAIPVRERAPARYCRLYALASSSASIWARSASSTADSASSTAE